MEFSITESQNTFIVKPNGILSDYEYDKIKEDIELLGGHWREKEKVFIFSKEIINSLTKQKRDTYQQRENTQFYPTPRHVARRLIELSGITKTSLDRPIILEPSAGIGNLLDEIPSYIREKAGIYVVETEKSNVDKLIEKGYSVHEMSFEEFYNKHREFKRTITHVIMNPPFSLGRDIHHTLLAYELLAEGGVLTGIISENSLYYNNSDSKMFREWLDKHNAYIEQLPYGSFKESGTMVDTALIRVIKS